jgi:hypothetical protein
VDRQEKWQQGGRSGGEKGGKGGKGLVERVGRQRGQEDKFNQLLEKHFLPR